MRQLVVSLLLLFASCSSPTLGPSPEVIVRPPIPTQFTGKPTTQPIPFESLPGVIQWSAWEREAGARWYKEAKKRFKDPIIFMCHGSYTPWFYTDNRGEPYVKSTWVVIPDEPRSIMPVEWVAKFLRNLYPNNDIVLIVCNHNGHKIQVPGVWYAVHKVWQTPDGYYYNSNNPKTVGSINEFTGIPRK